MKNKSSNCLFLTEIPQLTMYRTIILCWNADNKKIYHNCSTGEQSDVLNEVVDLTTPVRLIETDNNISNIFVGVTMQHITDEDLILITKIEFSHKRNITAGEKFVPEELSRVYISKNKQIFVPDGEYFFRTRNSGERTVMFNGNALKLVTKNINANELMLGSKYMIKFDEANDNAFQYTGDLFKSFFGEAVPDRDNNAITWSTINDISAWLNHKNYEKQDVAGQTELDKILEMKLGDPVIPENVVYDRQSNVRKFALIENIDYDEPMCVLRTFFIKEEDSLVYESGRIYIGNRRDKIYPCRQNDNGEYVYTPLEDMNVINWDFPVSIYDYSAIMGTQIQFFINIIFELDEDLRGIAIATFLVYPIIEQLYRNDFKSLVIDSFKNASEINPLVYVTAILGATNKSKTTLLPSLGLNSYQYNLLKQNQSDNRVFVNKKRESKEHLKVVSNSMIMVAIKSILNPAEEIGSISNEFVDISWLDDISFDKLFFFFEELTRKNHIISYNEKSDTYSLNSRNYHFFSSAVEAFRILYKTYGLKIACKASKLIKSTNCLNDEISESSSSMRLVIDDYIDYLYCLKDLNGVGRFKPIYRNLNELKILHDEASKLIYMKNSTADKAKWQKQKQNWDQYCYTGRTFSVIAPNEPVDLSIEGNSLCHCVKCYISRVCEGVTNILFIRRNTDLNKPFFTAEIKNNQIEQVHGFCNSNADSVDGLVDFIKEWASQCNLSISNYNKTR